MYCIEIGIVEQGTDVEGIERILLEQYQCFERTEAKVVQKPLQARVGSSYTIIWYRVYTDKIYDDIRDTFDRLKHRTKSDIRVTLPRSTHIFKVDTQMSFI